MIAEHNLHIKIVKWTHQYKLKHKSSKYDHEHRI